MLKDCDDFHYLVRDKDGELRKVKIGIRQDDPKLNEWKAIDMLKGIEEQEELQRQVEELQGEKTSLIDKLDNLENYWDTIAQFNSNDMTFPIECEKCGYYSYDDDEFQSTLVESNFNDVWDIPICLTCVKLSDSDSDFSV